MGNMLGEMIKIMALLKASIGTDKPFILAYSRHILATDAEKEAALKAFEDARKYFG
jgi:hypothetical protein